MDFRQRSLAYLEGVRAAAREIGRLGLDASRRTDIFRIIEGEGIWLLFRPMKELAGALIRQDDTVGVLVNSQHPTGLRRYTAAHEYGHWALGHTSSVDSEADVVSPRDKPGEISAQAFAGAFLMPEALLNRTLPPSLMDPRGLYRAAVEIGVTYTALVTHLAMTKRIRWDEAKALRATPPKKLKLGLTNGHPLESPWADVWYADEARTGVEIRPSPGDELHVYLREIPSSGYVWRPNTDSQTLLILDEYSSDFQPDQLGQESTRHFGLQMAEESRVLGFDLLRPWADASPEKHFEVAAITSEEELAGREPGFAQGSQQSLLLAARR